MCVRVSVCVPCSWAAGSAGVCVSVRVCVCVCVCVPCSWAAGSTGVCVSEC